MGRAKRSGQLDTPAAKPSKRRASLAVQEQRKPQRAESASDGDGAHGGAAEDAAGVSCEVGDGVDVAAGDDSEALPQSPSFTALARHISDDLPRGSSLRKHTIERLAAHLGAILPVEDFNHFARELQLAMRQAPPCVSKEFPLFSTGPVVPEDAGVLAAPAALESAALPALEDPGGQLVAKDSGPAWPTVPLELAHASGAIRSLCFDVRSRNPVVTHGGQAHEGNIRDFAVRMLCVAESPRDWEWAWELAGFADQPQATRYHAGYILITALCELVADSGRESAAFRAAEALATLLRAFFVKVRTMEDAISAFILYRGGVLEDCPTVSGLLSQLLVHIFPQEFGSDWGWPRVGWDWGAWWSFVERLFGNADHNFAMSVLRRTLEELEGRKANDGAFQPLRDTLSSCEWAKDVTGLGMVKLDTADEPVET